MCVSVNSSIIRTDIFLAHSDWHSAGGEKGISITFLKLKQKQKQQPPNYLKCYKQCPVW